MKKTISLIIISMLFTLFPSISTGEDADFPLNDQLKLIRKIEYPSHEEGIGPLVVDVDAMTMEACLAAVQAKIRDGYLPDYEGDFDNTFLNELMIGVENLRGYAPRSNHAHRKIEFHLKSTAPATPTPLNVAKYIKQNKDKLTEEEKQRVIMLHVIGLDEDNGYFKIRCYPFLTTNHQYIGLNFVQFFYNQRMERILGFVLLDHTGNVQWKQKTQPPARSHFPEEYGPATNEPFRSAGISNQGHVLAFHGKCSTCWELVPFCARLYDLTGRVVKEWPSFFNLGFDEFSGDGSRLLVKGSDGKKDEEYLISIDTADGTISWEYRTTNRINSNYSISQSYNGKTVLFKERSKFIVLNEKGELICSKDTDIEGCSFLTIALLPKGNFILKSSELYDMNFNLIHPYPNVLIKSNQAITSLTASTYDLFSDCIVRAGCTWTGKGEITGIGNRIFNIFNLELDPIASHIYTRNYFPSKYISPELCKISALLTDGNNHRIYFFSLTEFLEFEFSKVKDN